MQTAKKKYFTAVELSVHVYLQSDKVQAIACQCSRDNFIEISYIVLSMIEPRSLIQREEHYVGTTHVCGKLKGNAIKIDDLDYARVNMHNIRLRQRYLINVYAAFLRQKTKNLPAFTKLNTLRFSRFLANDDASNKFFEI